MSYFYTEIKFSMLHKSKCKEIKRRVPSDQKLKDGIAELMEKKVWITHRSFT